MADPIQGLNLIRPVVPGMTGQAAGPVGPPAGKDFKTILLNSLDQVNQLQTEADRSVERLLTGETDHVAEVLTAVNKAGIAFDLLMEIRNKLTDAYKEIQQMQV
jgi:flagellar hook-basal body complex protein FliE